MNLPFSKITRRRVFLVFMTIIVSKIVHYEWQLHHKYNGNFSLTLDYHNPQDIITCTDFSIKVDGDLIYHTDSLGSCTNTFGIDSIFNVPIGINCIEYQSERIKFYHKEYIFNFLFVFGHVEISRGYPNDPLDVFESVRFSYFPFDLM